MRHVEAFVIPEVVMGYLIVYFSGGVETVEQKIIGVVYEYCMPRVVHKRIIAYPTIGIDQWGYLYCMPVVSFKVVISSSHICHVSIRYYLITGVENDPSPLILDKHAIVYNSLPVPAVIPYSHP